MKKDIFAIASSIVIFFLLNFIVVSGKSGYIAQSGYPAGQSRPIQQRGNLNIPYVGGSVLLPVEIYEKSLQEHGVNIEEYRENFKNAVLSRVSREAESYRLKVEMTITFNSEKIFGFSYPYTIWNADTDNAEIFQTLIKSMVLEERNRVMSQYGFYINHQNYLAIDYFHSIRKNRLHLRGWLNSQIEHAREQSWTTHQLLEKLNEFIQRIPYEEPKWIHEGIHYFGFRPAVPLLVENGGDCDSKSTLLTLAWNAWFPDSMVLIDIPRHVFVAVRGIPRSRASDVVIRINGVDYLAVEPVGSARLKPGDIGLTSKRAIHAGTYSILKEDGRIVTYGSLY